MPRTAGWTFLSNHGLVLVCIAQEPGIRLRDLADRVSITRRAVQRIISDLEEVGYLSRTRQGRRNCYDVHMDAPLRHPMSAHCQVGHVLDLIVKPAPPPG